MSTNTYQLPIWLDLRPQLGAAPAVRLSAGPHLEAYLAASVAPGQYLVLDFNGVDLRQRAIAQAGDQRLFVQPLPHDRLLLASPRTSGAPNGHIWAPGGNLERTLLLGDGLVALQATAGGKIWAGYFDEGIYGNRGWLHPEGGISGLLAFDQQGRVVYELAHAQHVPLVTDSCMLNVVSGRELWCLYEHRYNSHPLVRIQDGTATVTWDLAEGGYSEFAIWQNYLLARHYYSPINEYHLFEIKPNGRPQLLASHQLLDHTGQPLATNEVAARADRFFLFQSGCLYRFAVQELVDRL